MKGTCAEGSLPAQKEEQDRSVDIVYMYTECQS